MGGQDHSAPELARPPTPGLWPSGARSAVWLPLPGNAASWPIRARLGSHYCKVSQNREVSPKSSQKACHSPCFQKRAQKSPLGILRFPISPAFSHKELMGRFDPYYGLYCQNDEVSTVCTRMYTQNVTRSGRQIPPRITPASWLL